jgi:beta-glucosidase
MNMRRILLIVILSALGATLLPAAINAAKPAPQDARPAYRDARLPVERRVADLLARMTLEEKVAQLIANHCGHC